MDQLEIEPREVKARLERGEKFLLLDCREPWEYELCRLPGAQLIPMGSIPSNLQMVEAAEDVVVYCHQGLRSLDVVAWLQRQGVEGARSMAGGIDRWSREIDSAVPRY